MPDHSGFHGKWQTAPDVLSSKVDEEVIIMSVAQGYYFGLDPVGSRIWELLSQPRSFEDLCDLLMEEYQVDEAVCRQEAVAFMQEMSEKKLILQILPSD